MKSDLEQFENRNDDWLARQRHLEDLTSAWDLDEGKRLKAEHEERHREYNRANGIHEPAQRMTLGQINGMSSRGREEMQRKKKAASAVISLVILIYVVVVMMMIIFM